MANPIIDFGYNWLHLAGTSQVSIRPGILHSVTINRPDPAGACVVTLYDSAAGATADIIAIIAMDAALYVIPTGLIYDAKLDNGLYVEFSAGFTLGDITVSFG